MTSASDTDALDLRARAATEFIVEAGALALQYFRDLASLTIERKGLQDRVSEADRAVEERLKRNLSARFPDDTFLGEESGYEAGSGTAPWTWVVDPIDGTDCFVHGIPVWCVSVALVGQHGVAFGCVYDPNADECFSARRGQGAWLNGAKISASRATSLKDGLVGIGFSHRVKPDATLDVLAPLLAAGGMFQRNGSGALMLSYVGAGRFIGYFEPHINSWDALAGLLVAQEAGARTNDFLSGDALRQGNVVFAAAPQVADELAALCRVRINSPTD